VSGDVPSGAWFSMQRRSWSSRRRRGVARQARRGTVALAFVVAAGCGSPRGAVAAEAEAGTAPYVSPSADEARAPARPDDLGRAFERAARTVRPAVVSVTAVHRLEVPPGFGSPFGFGAPDDELEARGLGSGVVLDTTGHILTNNHVVAHAEEIRVRFPDDTELVATIVGVDPKSDLAVIKVEAEGRLTPAVLGDSSQLHVGQWVLAVGSPFGLEQTVSAGIVSAVGRGSMGIVDYADFIQTDAAINPGNSGGPLIDLQGRVIGINTAIATRTGGSHGIGFAIPANMAFEIAGELIEQGQVVRGFLGIVIGPLDADLAQSFDYPGEQGVLVQDVMADGPADRAGLRSGDIVVERDGVTVEDATTFRNDIAALDPGQRTTLTVWRAGELRQITVELEQQPEDQAQPGRLGLGLSDLTPELRQRLGTEATEGAVVVQIVPGSTADRAGLRPGDLIVGIGDETVEDATAARQLLNEADLERGVRLRIVRDGVTRYLVLRESS
jgi:serine protease Do